MPTLKAKVDGSWITIGSVPTGLPPGGATNAILAKATAADYDMAWTATPALAGLTMTGSIVMANNMYLTGTHTGAGAQEAIIGLGSDDNIHIGPGLASGRVIYIGPAGATVAIVNLASNHAIRAAATINGGDGSVANGFGFASGSRLAMGSYRLTLSSGFSVIVPCVTPTHPSAAVFADYAIVSSTVIDVKMYYHDGTSVDCWFGIQVAGT